MHSVFSTVHGAMGGDSTNLGLWVETGRTCCNVRCGDTEPSQSLLLLHFHRLVTDSFYLSDPGGLSEINRQFLIVRSRCII